MASKKENYYRDLYQRYLSDGQSSLRTFSKANNISASTLSVWFGRFELENTSTGSNLLPFKVIAEGKSTSSRSTKPSWHNTTLQNLQLTTPGGIIVVIPEITVVSLSELVKSFIEP